MSLALASFLAKRYLMAEWSVYTMLLDITRYERNFSKAYTTASNCRSPSKNAYSKMVMWQFLELTSEFINGRFNYFSFIEFEFFPNSRQILFLDLGGGGGSLFKIASRRQEVPSRIPVKLDQLQMKLIHFSRARNESVFH
ncbi:hypothetical protein Tco_0016717 [Tanacetum coccineum]